MTGQAVASSLLFASDGAGTAVLIHDFGLVLTCGHCVAEILDKFENEVVKGSNVFWLLTTKSSAVKAVCVALDERRGLALLGAIGAQQPSTKHGISVEASLDWQHVLV